MFFEIGAFTNVYDDLYVDDLLLLINFISILMS